MDPKNLNPQNLWKTLLKTPGAEGISPPKS
jgi:hypothetical protein